MKSGRTAVLAAPSVTGNAAQTGIFSRLPLRDNSKSLLQSSILLGVFFASLLWVVDLRLIYHGGGMVRPFPVFYWGWDFAREYLACPGGPNSYLAALLAQSLYFSSLGAIVLSTQAALVFHGLRSVLKRLKADTLQALAAVPILTLLGVYCRYAPFSESVSSLTLTSAALLATPPPARLKFWTCATFLLVSPALLYVLTPAGALLYACMMSLLCMVSKERRALTPLPGLSVLIVGIGMGKYLFGLTSGEAFAALLPVPFDVELYGKPKLYAIAAVWLSFPITALAALAHNALRGSQTPVDSVVASRQPGNSRGKGVNTSSNPRRGARVHALLASQRPAPTWRALWLLETFGIVVAAITATAACHDSHLKSLLRADYCAWHQQWPEAITAAGQTPSDPYLCSISAQAGFHLGRLTRELPALTEPADLLLSNEGNQAHWRRSNLYLDLGYANMALHHLTEAVEFWGERPLLLRHLALVHLALGNEQSARLFLRALAKVPFHAAWARAHLKQFDADPTGSRDAEVQHLAVLKPQKDLVLRLTPEEELSLLLEANSTNRMAFEYLMTDFLLARNLDGFLKNFSRLNSFPGSQITPLWEDALVLAAAGSGRRVELTGYSDAERRFQTVVQLVNSCGGNKQLIRERLRDAYGKTYFYYFFTR